jgi:predicted nuclease of predicted toxin-antitoxin system
VIRFHLDESADGRLGRALRRRGFDITFPAEVGLLEANDEEHLAFALREGRVVITQDDDFL